MQLKVSLGEAEIPSGDFAAARSALSDAVDHARDLGDGPALINAVLQFSRTAEIGTIDEELIALTEEALEVVGEQESAPRAALLSTLSTEIMWEDPQEGRAMAQRGLEVARRAGDQATLALCLHRAVLTELHPDGSPEERLRLIDELADVAERTGETEFKLRAAGARIRENLELGDVERADREIAIYTELSAELRIPQHAWHVPLFGATRALIEGDLERAEKLALEARAAGARAGEPLSQQTFGIQLAQLRRLQGRVEELLPILREMTERFPALPAWRTALAGSLSHLGRVEEARGEFERLAAHDFEAIPRDAQFLSAIMLLSEVCVAVGDTERARLLYEWMKPAEGRVMVIARAATAQGAYDRMLGLLAGVQGDRGLAELHFGAALEIAERMGDRPMLAWSKIDFASMLLGVIGAAGGNPAEPDAEDHDRALDLLSDAIDLAREVGAVGLVNRALKMRLDAQGLSDVDISTSIDEVVEAVENERPDLSAHAAPDGTVTILFSDIVDSTVMTERLGDERWLELLRSHNTVFRQRIQRHGGYEVKSQGDGFMLAFADPVGALEFAVGVQRDFDDRAGDDPDEALRIRMGLHAGEVIAEEGDFFGKNVILAARIAAVAQGGEILVSSSLRDVAAERGGHGIGFAGAREVELKGLAGSHLIYAAGWEPQAAPA